MRGQVPDDVDVVLKKTQVDPDRIVEKELAKFALVDELFDLLHGAREKEGMVDHDPEVLLGRKVNELPGLSARRSKGLFHENVLPCKERRPGHLVMGEDRRDDRNGVHVRGPDEIQGVLRALDERIVALGQTEPLLRKIADRGQLCPGRPVEITGYVGPPITVPDDTNIKHDSRSLSYKIYPHRSLLAKDQQWT